MPYLERRVQELLSDVRLGRLILRADDLELRTDLDAVVVQSDGSVDLASCTDRVRAFARAYSSARAAVVSPAETSAKGPAPTVTTKDLADLNRGYFERLEEVFVAFTGKTPQKFADVGDGSNYGEAIRGLGAKLGRDRRLATKVNKNGMDALRALRAYLGSTNMARIGGARALPGSKLVLGGTQHFNHTSLAATRSMLLYADTVLIADPVLPWLEVHRSEERFQLTLMLQQVFYLSRLKPLVDADLPYPAVCVFPSFEKALEEKDRRTQDGIELNFIRLFSHYAEATFDDIQEILAFAAEEPDRYIEIVTRNRLFVPPDGDGSEPFKIAIETYKADMREWRSPEFLKRMERFPDSVLSTFAIADRLTPQFHVAENADMLAASPLFALPVQWHYFNLLKEADTAALTRQGVIKADTSKLVEALGQPSASWLGNVPVSDLVELRVRLDNEAFRRQLDAHIKELGGASEGGLDEVAARVVRGLTRMLNEHERELKKIADDYSKRHLQTMVGTWITGAAAFAPWFPLSPAITALTASTKYAYEKAVEKYSYRKQKGTLLGILAAAARKA